jgi:hypothetical protein
MSKMTKYWGVVVAALACAGLGYAPNVSAAIPASLTQQGRLLDLAGGGVDADVAFVFTIYDAPTAGTALWTETQTVTVDQGYFSARLGETTAFGATLFDGSKTLYLGVKVGTDAEMAPRQAITSVPFAFHAKEADHAAAADSATTATNATHAATADTATSATAANTATNANNATTVTSIASNITQANSSATAGTAAVTAACPSGYKAIAGGCNGNGALMVSSFVKNAPDSYQCQCAASCTVTTQVVCAK